MKTIQQRIDFVLDDLKKIVRLEDKRIKELPPGSGENLLAKRSRNKLQEIVQSLAVLEIPEEWKVEEKPEEPKAEPTLPESKKPVTKKKK